jgi:hypothetical protein
MSFEHIIFIPGTLLVGIVIGYVVGQRFALAQIERARQRDKR